MDCIDSRHYSGFLVNNFLSTKLLSQQKVIDRPSGNSYNKVASAIKQGQIKWKSQGQILEARKSLIKEKSNNEKSL